MNLSVIIPVYNVEKYLRRCLDSIFGQNFSGTFEVIAVNDASTDCSLEILEAYAKKYDNLKIINHETNKSVAVARKNGLLEAKGEYTIQVDSDDWIEQNMFTELIKIAHDNQCPDIVVFDYHRHDGNKILSMGKRIKYLESYNIEDKIKIQSRFFMGSGWNKMVKATLLRDLILGTRYVNSTEDLIFCFEIFLKASSILVVPKVYYNYFNNPDSLTSINPEKYLLSQASLYQELDLIVKKYNPQKDYLTNLYEYVDKWIYMALLRHHMGTEISLEAFEKFCSSYLQFRNVKEAIHLRKAYQNIFFVIKKVNRFVGVFSCLKMIVKLKIKN